MSQATVVERKQAFIRKQKQTLSRGIAPSTALLRIANDAGIQTKVLGDVMQKVNRDLKRQSREVYNRQMTDHVVEQIDLLYWEAGAPPLDAQANSQDTTGEDNDGLYQNDDLTVDKNISKLPVTWDLSSEPTPGRENEDEVVDQDDYITAAARLQDLSAQRLTLQQKLTTYKTLLSLLAPYRKPLENIQPNLVSRDAPLASELFKTRTLAIRVAGRLDEKYGNSDVSSAAEDSDSDEMVDENANAKLDDIIAGW